MKQNNLYNTKASAQKQARTHAYTQTQNNKAKGKHSNNKTDGRWDIQKNQVKRLI